MTYFTTEMHELETRTATHLTKDDIVYTNIIDRVNTLERKGK